VQYLGGGAVPEVDLPTRFGNCVEVAVDPVRADRDRVLTPALASGEVQHHQLLAGTARERGAQEEPQGRVDGAQESVRRM
jgi:hypothetical protein